MAQFQRFEHVNLSCRDLEATQRFYQTLFPDWYIRAEGPGWIHLGSDQFYLSLFEEPSQTPRSYTPYSSIGINHIGFVIQNGSDMQHRLEQQDIHYESMTDAPEAKFRVYLNDPDGNELELIEYEPAYALR